ncbi:unnamed protein product [Gulo gulo]|uniref:Uncharacterized protein n=1 Tax=Gulo gulo TaxID=48420 RepID=A0A9X9Q027_GULGU|nr:unnamed protein product [Gulo gulo]
MGPRLRRLGIKCQSPTFAYLGFLCGRETPLSLLSAFSHPHLHPSDCLFCPCRSYTQRNACMLWVRGPWAWKSEPRTRTCWIWWVCCMTRRLCFAALLSEPS